MLNCVAAAILPDAAIMDDIEGGKGTRPNGRVTCFFLDHGDDKTITLATRTCDRKVEGTGAGEAKQHLR